MKRSIMNASLLVLLVATVACKGSDKSSSAWDQDDKAKEKSPESPPQKVMESKFEEEEKPADELDDRATMAPAEGRMGKSDKKRASGQYAMKNNNADPMLAKKEAMAAAERAGVLGVLSGKDDGAPEKGPVTRSWFPETFLFQPLVVTDDSGSAEVSVRVPDRLTTWRVLGLAHSRNGSQAGAVTSFLGTLPTYVDLVVPPKLRVGDEVRLPIQLVNTTASAVTTQLSVEADGGTLTGGSGNVTIPASGSVVRFATIRATKAGTIRIGARLGDADAVAREIEVVPTGQPKTETRSGTLASERTLEIVAAKGVTPGVDRVQLTVFPGALALLRSELGSAAHRGGVAGDSFALLLAGKAPELLASLGDKADPVALRKLTILMTQRIVRHARTLNIARATVIADAALAHPDNPVLERLGKRAVLTIEAQQSPDGTCGGETGWTIQRLLVSTADCARAAKTSKTVPILAAGAFERNAKEIDDPYTASAVLAAGGASETLRKALTEKITSAIKSSKDGAKYIEVPPEVVRADGNQPSRVEATALAILALEGDATAPLADLGATILAGYSPHYGWGDGRTNLLCMQAVIALFKDPIPDTVGIELAMDGKVIATGTLERAKVRELLVMRADSVGAAGTHSWTVKSVPPIPGLGFSLAVTSWTAWKANPQAKGLELTIDAPKDATVGVAVELVVRAAVPSGDTFDIDIELPAGVQADERSLQKLTGTAISSYKLEEGKIKMIAMPLEPAQLFKVKIRVIPTLRGSLQSGPAKLTVNAFEKVTTHLPPVRWTVR